MQANISPTSLTNARYLHRQVLDKIRPAARIGSKASFSVAVSAIEADFHNAVSFSLFGTPCLETIATVIFDQLGKAVHIGQSDRQSLIARLLVAVNDLSVGGLIVPIPHNRVEGLAKSVEERARLIVEANVVAMENNAALPVGSKWLPGEKLATAIANISKAIALVYSLGTPSAHMPELQHLLKGEKKCKALSLLMMIGWHLDQLEHLLRPVLEMPASESARLDLQRAETRAARARETTLIVIHPPAGITYWSLWRLANHALIAPQAVLEVVPTTVPS